MKSKVAKLNMKFKKLKSMTGFANVKVFEVDSVPERCSVLPILRIPTLYDPGSVGEALDDGVDLYTLKNSIISVQTFSGIEQKNFTRRKLKPQGFIRNYDSILVNSIKIRSNNC